MTINYAGKVIPAQNNKTINSNLQTYQEASYLRNFQKILLTANGTVTALLESYLNEEIKVFKLSENVKDMDINLPRVKLNQEKVITRKILLQGKNSSRNFIYADSLILINNIDEQFRCELLNTKKPIGKIWSERKVETFKEIIDSGKEPANELSKYFGIEPEENMLFRTYSVYSKGKITMIITEKFPESYFLAKVPLA